MKVLIVNAYSGYGSTGKIVESIADTVEAHGHQSYIAYGFFKTQHKNAMKLKWGGKYHNFYEIMKCRLTGYFGYTSRFATYRLIRWIKKNKPDVINLHNIHGGYVHVAILARFLKTAGIPIVWTLHDCWTFTGHCAYFQQVQCDKWKSGCFDCPEVKHKQNYPISYFFDRSKQQYKWKKTVFSEIPNVTMVTPSQWLEDLVRQSYFGQAKFLTIHNGINLEVFKPRESDCKKKLGCEEKHLVLAVAASWSGRKGLNYVLQLAERLPSEEYQVVIVGINEKQMSMLPEQVIGIRRTNSAQELAELYTAASVLVNPTLDDNYPTVNLEAIACGTPVVTFRTGGSPESIISYTGKVIEKHDIDGLVNAVEEWSRTDVQQKCREYALEHFDANDCFEKYVHLFEKVLSD